jgi:hypothetical protein
MKMIVDVAERSNHATALNRPAAGVARSSLRAFCAALLVLSIHLAAASQALAQTEIKAGEFQFKPSGFGNLTGGNASGEPGGGVGGVSENELELSPQYRLVSGTIFAARGVLNVNGSVAGPHVEPARSRFAHLLSVPRRRHLAHPPSD